MLRSSSRYHRAATIGYLSRGRRCPHAGVSLSARCLYHSDAFLLSAGDAASPGSNAPPPPPHQPNREEEYVSDKEWELRTSRAIDILQQTLPTFFSTGLVATAYRLPLHMHGVLGGKGTGKLRADESRDEHGEGIYARTIRLEYTPPVMLPAPFPSVLSVEGLPLYVSSSIFVRHTLNALFTDLSVSMHKVYIRSGLPSHPNDSSSSSLATKLAEVGEGKRRREKAITIALLVSGMSRLRLSDERGEWDVTSTYSFCPRTGHIVRHIVNAIDPAPSETVYTSFQNALSSLSGGLAGPSGDRKSAINVTRGLREIVEDHE